MLIDIVFPENNEDEFIKIAVKLGYNAICFAYKFDKSKNEKQKELIKEKQKNSELKLYLGILADFNEIGKAKNSSDLVLVQNSEKNREVLESGKADILFDLEAQNKRDFMHHRASGLNHILCTFAKKNDLKIGLSFSSILKSSDRHQLVGRMSQNIKLCRKYKVKMCIASFAKKPYEMRSPNDLMSLFETIGMHPKEAKDSFKAVFRKDEI